MRRDIVKGLFGLLGFLGIAACGGTAATSDVGPGASAPIVAADATAPVLKGATHLKLGFAFTANLLGELEPCG